MASKLGCIKMWGILRINVVACDMCIEMTGLN